MPNPFINRRFDSELAMYVHSEQVQQQSRNQAQIGIENSVGFPSLFE
jgi:hypothetical protein